MDNSDAIRALRKQLGWTQRRLADELRKSEHTVKRWEMGIRDPSFELLEKLAALSRGRLARFFAVKAGLPREALIYLRVQEGIAEQTEERNPTISSRLLLRRSSPPLMLRENSADGLRHQLLAKVLRSGNRKAIDAVTKTLEVIADALPTVIPKAARNRRKSR